MGLLKEKQKITPINDSMNESIEYIYLKEIESDIQPNTN